MTRRRQTKFVHEGEYVAEVEVEPLESAEGWAPYLSLEDAKKLDEVREALRRGATVRALIVESRSRRSHWRRMGVWPRGDNVRRQTGWSMKPLSSRKTRLLPPRRAFFFRPALGPPAQDGRLVPLPRSALWSLAAPPFPAQDLPDMGGVVPDRVSRVTQFSLVVVIENSPPAT